MALNNFPASLQPLIQQGFLERSFRAGLTGNLGFRAISQREQFAVKIGETITSTRAGLKAPVETPLNAANLDSNLDNGMTASGWTVEQFTLTINPYGDTQNLNMVTTAVGIGSQFLQNAKVSGYQAMQSLDRLSRNALFDTYMGGNTRVRVSSSSTSVQVDDVRGFGCTSPITGQVMGGVVVNGKLIAPNGAQPLAITINGNAYSVTGVSVDGSNSSTVFRGLSGVLTLASAVSAGDGATGNAVVSNFAPTVLRVNARATSNAFVAGDILTMGNIQDAMTQLRNNAVPTIDGDYHVYLDNVSMRQLFADPAFQLLYRGQSLASQPFATGTIVQILGCKLIPTTEAPQQQNNNVLKNLRVHRPIVVGAGALIEGDFAATGYSTIGDLALFDKEMIDGVCMLTRAPMDRLGMDIAQSWYWIGGFVAPTDVTANIVIPTAAPTYYKRAVIIEHCE